MGGLFATFHIMGSIFFAHVGTFFCYFFSIWGPFFMCGAFFVLTGGLFWTSCHLYTGISASAHDMRYRSFKLIPTLNSELKFYLIYLHIISVIRHDRIIDIPETLTSVHNFDVPNISINYVCISSPLNRAMHKIIMIIKTFVLNLVLFCLL